MDLNFLRLKKKMNCFKDYLYSIYQNIITENNNFKKNILKECLNILRKSYRIIIQY